MKQFEMMQIKEAKEYAMSGGQALHIHNLTQNGHRHFKRYSESAHLLDQNRDRLVLTAKRLGVRVIKVDHPGTQYQHIDLCGKPLIRAKATCSVDNSGSMTLLPNSA